MHSYVAFLMYPDIRRCTIEELTPERLKYIKEEYPDKRFLAKVAGFAIKPFYLTIFIGFAVIYSINFYYLYVCSIYKNNKNV